MWVDRNNINGYSERILLHVIILKMFILRRVVYTRLLVLSLRDIQGGHTGTQEGSSCDEVQLGVGHNQ